MAVAPSDIAKVRVAFDDLIQSAGEGCAWRLRTGETFTIQGVLRIRPEEDMTSGMQQGQRRLSVMDQRWRSAAPPGRAPEKGDQVTIDGKRYAVMEADAAVFGGQRIGWRVVLKG